VPPWAKLAKHHAASNTNDQISWREASEEADPKALRGEGVAARSVGTPRNSLGIRDYRSTKATTAPHRACDFKMRRKPAEKRSHRLTIAIRRDLRKAFLFIGGARRGSSAQVGRLQDGFAKDAGAETG